MFDYFRLAVKNLAKRRTRTYLTLIGIFIGIAAVVALVSLGQGMQEAINEQFELLGTDKIFVQPGGVIGAPGSSTVAGSLSEDDVDLMEKVRGVKMAAGYSVRAITVEYDEEVYFAQTWGFPTDEQERELIMGNYDFDVIDGRMTRDGDSDKVVVGYRYKYGNIFDKPVDVGDKILLEGVEFEVVGIADQIGSPPDDAMITMTKEALKDLYGLGNSLDLVMVQVVAGDSTSIVAEELERKMRKDRDEEEGSESFNIQTSDELIDSFNVVLGAVQAVLVGIAAISLLVGGVGIMNTMYTAVMERTNEIGIMKAVGARKKDILTIFLIEAGFLGLVGGLFGAIIGLSISKLVEIIIVQGYGITFIKAYFSFTLVFGALLFSMIVGAVSGFFPARQAANMNPVDAFKN